MAAFELISFRCRTCAEQNVVAQNFQNKMVECRKCTTRQIPKATVSFGVPEWESSKLARLLIDVLYLFGVERKQRQLRLAHCAALARLMPTNKLTLYEQVLRTGELWAESNSPPEGARELRLWLEARLADHPNHLLAVACVTAAYLRAWTFSTEISDILADAYRDVFPNPFVPLEWNPEWFTSTVRGLAAHMYEGRDFSAMPVLGDALQDAGCEHELVLDHCRGPKPHARGCWVVDAILGKG